MFRHASRNLRFCIRAFWTLVLFVLISFAVVIQVGRLLFPYLNDYKEEIAQVLSEQLGTDIDIDSIQADWTGLRPRVLLTGIHVSNKDQQELIFDAKTVELEISLLSFLHDWRLAFRKLSFVGLTATFEQKASGLWHVRGLADTSYKQDDSRSPIIDDPLDIFLFGRRLELKDTQLTFLFDQGLPFEVAVPEISVDNDDDFHRLSAALVEQQGEQSGEDFFTLIIEAYGDPRDEVGFDASGYVKLNRFPSDKVWQALDEIWRNKEGKPLLPKASSGAALDVELWMQGTLNRGLFVHGQVNIDGVPFELNQGVLPERIQSSLIAKWSKETGWRANFQNFTLSWSEFSAPAVNLGLEKKPAEPVEIKVDEVDLQAWRTIAVQAAWAHGKGLEILEDLSPVGRLKNCQITLTDKDQGYFRLAAETQGVGVAAWRGAPSVNAVDGYIETTAFEGMVMLDNTAGFTMAFPKLYNAPLAFEEASGAIRWDVDLKTHQLGISSGLLTLKHSDYVGKGYFNLRSPLKKRASYEQALTLVVGVESAPANAHEMLIPSQIPKDLYQWINQAVQGGKVSDAGFIYHGSIKPKSKLFKGLQLSMDVQQADMRFAPEWPALKEGSGHFYLDNNDVHVSQVNGVLKGNNVNNAQVLVPAKAGLLYISGELKGKVANALNLLADSPVGDQVGDSILSWRAGGQYEADAKLAIPLSKKTSAKARQDIAIKLKKSEIDVKPARLPLRGISGDLQYSNKSGFKGKKLQGSLFGQPIEVTLDTLQNPEKTLRIDFDSRLRAQDLLTWLHLSDALRIVGETSIQGRIEIPYDGKKDIVVTADSNLVGLGSEVPPPLNKPVEDLWLASLRFTFSRDIPSQHAEYWVSVQNQLEVNASVDESILSALSVGFNESAAKTKPNYIALTGNAVNVDVSAWFDYIGGLRKSIDSESASSAETLFGRYVIESALSIRRLTWGDNIFDHTSLVSDSDPESWQLIFENKDIRGAYQHFYDGATPKLTLDKLILPEASRPDNPDMSNSSHMPNSSERAGGADKDNTQVDPREIPALIVNAKGIRVGEQTLGAFAFTSQPIEQGVVLSKFNADLNGLKVGAKHEGSEKEESAELIWIQSEGQNKSYLRAAVHAGDIGQVLLNWNKEEMLTSREMKMAVALEWDDVPHKIGLNNLQGKVNLSLARGRFIRGASAGENPLLKLIGLLNFDTLARRLRLDFSDLNPQGMAYEKVGGELIFDVGNIELKRPLEVETPSSNISFFGSIDLEAQLLDAEVTAVLPITGNLTMAAAFTGGVPAAIGVYLAGKLFKDQVESIGSLKYDVKGEWDNPEVKLKNAVKVDRPDRPSQNGPRSER